MKIGTREDMVWVMYKILNPLKPYYSEKKRF